MKDYFYRPYPLVCVDEPLTYDYVFDFGPHEGKTIIEVFNIDAMYLLEVRVRHVMLRYRGAKRGMSKNVNILLDTILRSHPKRVHDLYGGFVFSENETPEEEAPFEIEKPALVVEGWAGW